MCGNKGLGLRRDGSEHAFLVEANTVTAAPILRALEPRAANLCSISMPWSSQIVPLGLGISDSLPLPHIPSVGDNTGTQWPFSAAAPQLDTQPEVVAVAHRRRDGSFPAEEADGRDPALGHAGEWQPYWMAGDTAMAAVGNRRGRGREEEDTTPPDTSGQRVSMTVGNAIEAMRGIERHVPDRVSGRPADYSTAVEVDTGPVG